VFVRVCVSSRCRRQLQLLLVVVINIAFAGENRHVEEHRGHEVLQTVLLVASRGVLCVCERERESVCMCTCVCA
jgi:hypothetical protein